MIKHFLNIAIRNPGRRGEASANNDPCLPMPVGAALKQDLPGINPVVRTQQGWAGGMVKANGKIGKQGLSFAEPGEKFEDSIKFRTFKRSL